MDIVTFTTTEEFVRAAAEWISGAIVSAQKNGEMVTVGLSGGKTPQPVYTLLATDQKVDWKKVRFFLVDERCVPADHADSNQGMIRRTLLTREAADATMIFPQTSLPIAACIRDYDEQIQDIVPDIVILGMGDDGHIASLFPPLGPEAYGPARVIHTTTDVFPVRDRISVTLPVLYKASQRLFLITGQDKAALLKKMQQTNEDVSLYPAQYLFDDRTVWMVGP